MSKRSPTKLKTSATNKVREFAVVIDTNSIWTSEDQLSLFQKEFLEKWKEICQPEDIKLLVPEIVFEELASQKYRKAYKTYKEAWSTIESAEKKIFAKKRRRTQRTQEDFKKKVIATLNSQLKNTPKCEILNTPSISQDTIKKIIQSAVWRELPFKDDKEGTGFRDAIILESVQHAHASMPHVDFAFISKDFLLRKAAKEMFIKVPNFGAFESIDEFSNFLTAARSAFTPEFLHRAISLATDAFISQINQEELTNKLIGDNDLGVGKIGIDKKEFSYIFSFAKMFSSEPNGAYQCISEPEIKLARTFFISVVGADNKFHFATAFVAHATYGKLSRNTIFSLEETNPPIKKRYLIISVEWEASIDKKFNFSDVKILSINTLNDKYEDLETGQISNQVVASPMDNIQKT